MSDTPTTEHQETNLSQLAKHHFGSEYKGEVTEPEIETPEEETKPEEQEEIEQPAEVEAAKVEEVEEATISSLSDLIEQNEWDSEWFNSIEVPVKVDGQESKAKFSDLVASYQTQQAATKNLNEAKEKGRVQAQAFAEKNEQLQSQFAIAAKLIEQSEQLLHQDESAIDWAKLREQDPAEWTAKKAEFSERKNIIERLKNTAISEYQNFGNMTKAERDALQAQRLQDENQKLLKLFPEWSDNTKRAAGASKIAKYLVDTIGYTPEDVAGASDHRMVAIAHKAMLYDELAGKVEPAKKKVARIPKMMKSGSIKPQDQINREKLQQLEAKARKSGSIDDAMEWLRFKRQG